MGVLWLFFMSNILLLPLIFQTLILILILLFWYKDRDNAINERLTLGEERKDLYDRLMARNFVEYKDNVDPESNEIEDEESDIADIDDAKEEITEGQNG